MYQLIYDFIKQHLFTSNALATITYQIGGSDMHFDEWLSHSLTIISLVLIFIALVCFVKWIFGVISGLFLLR